MTERRIAQLLILCLALSTVVLSGLGYFIYKPERYKQAAVRAEMDATAVAAPVNRAISLGIPMTQLQGVEVFFQNRLKNSPHILGIELRSSDGKTLWRQGELAREDGISGMAPLLLRNEKVGSIVLTTDEAAFQPTSLHAMLILLIATCAMGLTLYEAVHFFQHRGPLRRESIVRLARHAMQAGDWRQVFSGERRHEHDERAQWLRTQVRLINERFERIERLVTSLRHTEPSRARRYYLEQVLSVAQGKDLFAQGRPSTVRVECFFSEVRWLAILAFSAAESMRVLAAGDGGSSWVLYSLGAGILGMLSGVTFASKVFVHQTRHATVLLACTMVIAGLIIAAVSETLALLLAARAFSSFGAGCLLWCLAGLDMQAPEGAMLKEGERLEWRQWGLLTGAEFLGPTIATLLVPLLGRAGTSMMLATAVFLAVNIMLRGYAQSFWTMPTRTLRGENISMRHAGPALAGFGACLLWKHWVERAAPLLSGLHALEDWSLLLCGWSVMGLAFLASYKWRACLGLPRVAPSLLLLGAAGAFWWGYAVWAAAYSDWIFLLPTGLISMAIGRHLAVDSWFGSMLHFYAGALAALLFEGALRFFGGGIASAWPWWILAAGLLMGAARDVNKHAA